MTMTLNKDDEILGNYNRIDIFGNLNRPDLFYVEL